MVQSWTLGAIIQNWNLGAISVFLCEKFLNTTLAVLGAMAPVPPDLTLAATMPKSRYYLFLISAKGRTLSAQWWRQGRAREAIAPHRSMLAPVGRQKAIFSEIFGIYSILKTIFQPPRRKIQPPVGKFLAPLLFLLLCFQGRGAILGFLTFLILFLAVFSRSP